MPCPTCGHTLECVGSIDVDGAREVFHCDRCGTMTIRTSHGGTDVYVPKLVGRARRYRTGAGLTPEQRELWHAAGLDEATLPPAERPAEPTTPPEEDPANGK